MRDGASRRDDERDALDRHVASVRAGESRALVVSGEAGVSVQYHLRKVFAKLGIESRTQLDRALPD